MKSIAEEEAAEGQDWLNRVIDADEEERRDRERLLSAVEDELFAPVDLNPEAYVVRKKGYCDPARVPEPPFLGHDSQMQVE